MAHQNRLARETSPYLLQHAANPVAWFAWGPEAFEAARERGVPVFLSIGYATCYWCHVMERESFEDEGIGALMSELFVCVKVDREERPDVDDIYMAAVQAMTGRGGWPMSVFLTPPGARGESDAGLEPFWGGTYLPPEPRWGMASFEQTLRAIRKAWDEQRAEVLEQAARLSEHVREALGAERENAAAIGERECEKATRGLLSIYDRVHGGYGAAPKFPQPVFCEFLLDRLDASANEDEKRAIEMSVRHTLERMALGGMYDQIGGGFHRYSVDEKWLVPHFEKMLYDNAQLLSLYSRAMTRWKSGLFARVVKETAEYVLAEMTGNEGLFWSAQDAEVDGKEGLNYLWTAEEIEEAVGGGELGEYAKRVYGVDGGANFRDPHHPGEPPRNVLFLVEHPREGTEVLSDAKSQQLAEGGVVLGRVRTLLAIRRAQRKQPRLDDKSITSWNGLMISGLSDAGLAHGERVWVEAAARASEGVWTLLRDERGGLLRTRRAGVSKTAAFLEDYAFYVRGLLALDRAERALGMERSADHVGRARELTDAALELFGDGERGGMFDTRAGERDLIVRTSSTHDGALASGQSVMAHNLLELGAMEDGARYAERAEGLLRAMSRAIAIAPVSVIEGTRALQRVVVERKDVATRLMEGDEVEVGVAAGASAQRESPVEVYASDERVSVSKGKPGMLALELRIENGWHITANRPFGADEARGIEGLIGLEVFVRGGKGVRGEVEYPEGEALRIGGEEAEQAGVPSVRVHSGRVRLEVKLTRTEEQWEGRPLIYVRYQACTDRECYQPMVVELDVAVDPE